jgi:hypothetical protein
LHAEREIAVSRAGSLPPCLAATFRGVHFPIEINGMLKIVMATAAFDAAKNAWEPCEFSGDNT